MAKVSLRIYNREIESMVDRGQLDEAIAHCRHILNAFPKHLETYRMLGKAYLEAKRYPEATDIFERVLMAVPDDFVAHVGMSIINDEQGEMDAAIWHMERAFEVQPSNAAIQAELQRLYGRRDGVEPPKIRLTRGALAHMYVQGELYPQAISEISSVLEEDPGRQDMQVLLARAYFHAGQKGEAAEMCSNLLRRYPYCFDANRVLVELLPQTERGESTQVYLHRITEMDPYSTFVTGSVFHLEEVADAAVNLERLEWDGKPVDMEPAWSDSLGIMKGEDKEEEQPDWLKTGLKDDSESEPVSTDEAAPAIESIPVPTADDLEDIPDFLREAGWGADSGTFQEGAVSFDEVDDSKAEGIEEGDLPDWVRAMAPEDADESAAQPEAFPVSEDLTQDDVPDWLQGLGVAQGEAASIDEPKAGADEDADWLASIESEGESTDEQIQEQAAGTPADTGDLPDWLSSMEFTDESQAESQEQAAEIPADGDDLPDWLSSQESVDESQAEPQEQAIEAPASEDDVTDWLQSLKPEEQAAPDETSQEFYDETPEVTPESLSDWQFEDSVTSSENLGTSAEEQDDAVAWLEGLASKHGAKPEELVTDPNARKETAPDWVKQASAGLEQGEPEMPANEESQPDISADAENLGTSAEEQDDAVAWLESLASKHGAKPEELVTDPATRKETAPDWVQQAQAAQEQDEPGPDVSEEQVPIIEEPAQPVEIDAHPEAPLSAESPGASAEEQDEAVAWLEGLASKHGAKPEELVTDPNARKDTAPDWVQQASDSAAEQPNIEGEPAPVEETPEADPDWMKHAKEVGESLYSELEDSHSQEALPAEDKDETGMWLQELGEETGNVEDQIKEPAADEDVSSWLSGLGLDETEPEAAPEAEATPEPGGEETPEPPAWLHSLEGESSDEEALEPSTKEVGDDDLPSWLSGIDDTPQEQPAGDGNLPAWLSSEDEDEPGQPEPTAPTDWKPEEPEEPTQEEEPPSPETKPAPEPQAPPQGRPAYQEPVTRSRSGMTGMLSPAQDTLLIEAQNELTRSNIPAAMESYAKLIKKGKMLDEVIYDLREALYRYPVEVSILQTLGDAYMRANRLQDALDSYTKAEELLR